MSAGRTSELAARTSVASTPRPIASRAYRERYRSSAPILSRITDALTGAVVMTFADKGYQGARGSVRTPFKRRRFRPKLSHRQKAVP